MAYANGRTRYNATNARIVVVRSFLFNHLYHHRGELVSHLRATGNKVPGLYGPSYEEAQAMMAQVQ